MSGDPTVWGIVCPCNTISDYPQPCPYHHNTAGAPWLPVQQWHGTTTTGFLSPQHLSDEDVERIAQRVVELLKAAP